MRKCGTTTEFLYDGDRLVAEYSGTGTLLRRYAHGPGVDEPLIWYEGSGTSDPRWLIADRQGSIIATTNASGTATTYAYDPYGIPREWAGPRFRYTGQAVLPELQLYHYKARVYDPVLGRFLQTDPVGYEDDLNLYQYTRNNPLNATDPSGMDIVCDDEDPPNCRETIDLVITARRNDAPPLTQREFSQITRQYSNQLATDATLNYVLPAVAGGAAGFGVGLAVKGVSSLIVGRLFVGQRFGVLGTVIGKQPGAANALQLTPYSAGRMLERGMDMQAVRSVVGNPAAVLAQSGGRTLYISEAGAVVVGADGTTVVTAYSRAYFDDTATAIVTAATR